MEISVRANVKQVEASLDDWKRRQIPFATVQALNGAAFAVRQAETDELFKVFDGPTPFTQKSFRVEKATKSSLRARVSIGDVQAQYLAPFIQGGKHFLGAKKGLILPVNQPVNQYGNLPRATLQRQLAKPNVFIGKVNGVGGVWQRTSPKTGHRLKLLERFVNPKDVKQSFPFDKVATTTVTKAFPKIFGSELAKAIATAR
jgi:hypothetical protein